MSSLVIAGAHCLCYINGRLYAQVESFEWTSATPRKEIHGIDSCNAFELAPTTTRCSGSLNLFRLIGDGGLEGPGISARYEDLPQEKYFSLQLVERRGDSVLFEARSCCVESQHWSTAARGLMRGSLSFRAISWGNEVKG